MAEENASVENWETILSAARIIAKNLDGEKNSHSFTLVDLSSIRRKLKLWRKFLPSVKPYYAIKCNNDPVIIGALSEEDCAFDCASQGEMEQVLSVCPDAEIILAHPVKNRECIRFAAKRGIHRMTFDTKEELIKMAECNSQQQPILRIKVSGFDSLVDLNEKFGSDREMSEEILHFAAKEKIPIAGISFHIGSGVEDYRPMERTIGEAKELIEFGRKLGHPMEILDIGGGIIYTNERQLSKLGSLIEKSLANHFKEDEKITVISEPGRYFVSQAQFAVAKVLLVSPKRANDEKEFNVFINDGVYGSFNYVATEQRRAKGIPLNERNEGTMTCDIWGQTACSFDIIEKDRVISTLGEGDWLIYQDNGAYSNVLTTEFNGFPKAKRMYINSSEVLKKENGFKDTSKHMCN